MKKKNAALIAIASAALLLAGCQSPAKQAADSTAATPLKTEEATADIENFKVTKLDGTETDLHSLLQNAELTVLNLWEPGCDTCPEEMKALAALGDQYSGKGVQIVGIVKGVFDKNDEAALSVISETDANYIQLLDSKELEAHFAGLYQETPSTLLVSPGQEQLGKVYPGANDKAFWKKEIDKYHGQACENNHPAESAAG